MCLLRQPLTVTSHNDKEQKMLTTLNVVIRLLTADILAQQAFIE